MMDYTTFSVMIRTLRALQLLSLSHRLFSDISIRSCISEINKQVIFLSTKFLSMLECESCQLEKYFRSSFVSRENKQCMSPFEVIYTDIWSLYGLNHFHDIHML